MTRIHISRRACFFLTLVLSGVPVSAQIQTLPSAAEKGDIGAVTQLIANHTNINDADDVGATALLWACRRNDATMTRILLAAGANPNLEVSQTAYVPTPGGPPWALAPDPQHRRFPMHSVPLSVTTDPDIVEQLITAGANINQVLATARETPLLFFISRWADPIPKPADTAIVKNLLDAGASANVRGTAGDTALHILAIKESGYDISPEARTVLGDLLQAGAPIDARDALLGSTPLMLATRLVHFGMFKELLAKGANYHLRDASGSSVEEIAYQEHTGFASYIIDYETIDDSDPPAPVVRTIDCISGIGWTETWDANYIHPHDHTWTINTWSNGSITLMRDDGVVDGTLWFRSPLIGQADYSGSLVDHKPPDAGQYTDMHVSVESCNLLKVNRGWWFRRGGTTPPPIVSSQPEWQIDAMWCLNDQGSSGTAYRTTCNYGDQFGAVLACERGNNKATAAIEAAGRTAVNDYMAPVQPGHCHKGSPVQITTHNQIQSQQGQYVSISVNVENASIFEHSFDIHDNVCNTDWQVQPPLAAGETRSIALCSNGALTDGYASFKAKYSENNVWTNFDQVRAGETRSLN